MYIVYKLYERNGQRIYTKHSIIGIYDNLELAKENLYNMLNKQQYKYDIHTDDINYVLIECYEKSGIEFEYDYLLYFEIIETELSLNRLSAYG